MTRREQVQHRAEQDVRAPEVTLNIGAALNEHLAQDIRCLHQSQKHYGLNTWFAGHRNGASGLSNPSTTDINHYKAAVYWIKAQLDSDSADLRKDTRFWVQVPAI
ncbi:hypothetical protein ACH4UM_06065 [Streptomyces sp. NPDC020801]|uniref:hypothetical protein n=1 Tax=unclassified Streptomyces TaxID=2593676 RepID=UPI0037A61E40